MCRNITELRGLEPAATAEEIEAAARQYVRKVSGITRPTAANAEAFEAAVAEVTATTTRLLSAAAAAPSAAEDRAAAASSRGSGPARRDSEHAALKEWSAAVHAMLDGRQTVLLRKGGIGEKRFDVAAAEFVFFPTVAHGHAERVRPEHRDLLERRRGRQHRGRGGDPGGRRKWLPPLRSSDPTGLDDHRGHAHLDGGVGARRPAGLPAQAPADGAGGSGAAAARAGATAARTRLCGLQELGRRARHARPGATPCTTTRCWRRSPNGSRRSVG